MWSGVFISGRAVVVAALMSFAIAITTTACQTGDDSGSASEPQPGAAVVARHVDGDTLDVFVSGREERVRLTGIDTPEVAHPGTPERPGNDAECYGDAAASLIVELLPLGTEIRLERDVVARDDYGRLLAYVHRVDDEMFVNAEIVQQGFAQPLSIEPNVTYAPLFVEAARDAESADRGLWGACST